MSFDAYSVSMCYFPKNGDGIVDIDEQSDDKEHYDPDTKVYFKAELPRSEFLEKAQWVETKKFPGGELNIGSSLFSFTNSNITLLSDDGKHVAVCYHYGKAIYLAGIMVPNDKYTKSVIKAFDDYAKSLKGKEEVL